MSDDELDEAPNEGLAALAASNLGTLEVLQKAEIDQQIATAKKYPRSITSFLQRAKALVTLNQEVAESCNYALPRTEKGRKKLINGPSIRFAEIIRGQFGNCRSAARIVGEEDGYVIAQGVFHDLEANAWNSSEVRRRIVDRNGNRYSVDMVGVTSNAACSIAERNAILKGVGRALWGPLYESAVRAIGGTERTLEKRRLDMLEHFRKLGVKDGQVFAAVGVPGIADIGLEELAALVGIANAIRDGTMTAREAFEPPEEAATSTADKVAKDIAGADDDRPKPKEPDAPSLPDPGELVREIRARRKLKTLEELVAEFLPLYQAADVELPIEVDAALAEMREHLKTKETSADD